MGLSGQLGASDSSAPSPPTVHSSTAIATLGATEAQLREYFAGERQDFDLPMHLVGTDFQQEAWRGLADIPHGQTISYGEQAERLGRPKAVRAVKRPTAAIRCRSCCPATGWWAPAAILTGFAAGTRNQALAARSRVGSGAPAVRLIVGRSTTALITGGAMTNLVAFGTTGDPKSTQVGDGWTLAEGSSSRGRLSGRATPRCSQRIGGGSVLEARPAGWWRLSP